MKIALAPILALSLVANATASESCHERAVKRIERLDKRTKKTGIASGSLATAALLPGFGVVWFTFPAGPAIYGGLMLGAAGSGVLSGYHALRARHFLIQDLKFRLVSGETVGDTRYLEKATRQRDAFIKRIQSIDPSITVEEIEKRFSELDAAAKICTQRGRYFSDQRIAKAILDL